MTPETVLTAYLALCPADRRRFRGMLARQGRQRLLDLRFGMVHSYITVCRVPAQTLADWRAIRDYLALVLPATVARRRHRDLHAPPARPVSPRALRDGYRRWVATRIQPPPPALL